MLVLQVTLATDASQAAAGMRDLAVRLVAGLAIGAAGGFILTLLLRFPRLVRGLENILVLASVTLMFHLGEHVLSQSGLIAVTAAGVIVGNFENPVIDDLREFKDQLTLLLIGGIFILLAADVRMVEVQALGVGGPGRRRFLDPGRPPGRCVGRHPWGPNWRPGSGSFSRLWRRGASWRRPSPR